MASLVFDIGGTSTRAGLVGPDGTGLLRVVTADTPNHLDRPDDDFAALRDALLDRLDILGAVLAAPASVHAVTVAFAGPIAPSGEVLAAPTLWGERLRTTYRIRDDLQRLWPNARILVLNDVTAAGYRFLRGSDDALCIVTVSSGIGNKIFSGGRPLLGPSGAGGELGHLRVDPSPEAPVCECGGRGHLAALSSGRAVLAHARAHAPAHLNPATLTNGDLAAAFHREEPWAQALIRPGAAALGWALAAVHLAMGSERFVLVGGFALAFGEGYRRLVAEAAQACCWNGGGTWNAWVELGVNDDLAGLIGAAVAGSLTGGMP